MTSAARSSSPSRGRFGAGRSARRRDLLLLTSALAGLVGLSLHRYAAGDDAHAWEYAGSTMGTRYRVLVDERLDDDLERRARRAVQSSLDEVNRSMSTWDPTSEISRFNQRLATEPHAVSGGMLEVVAMALEIARRSDGAFDPTIAPLVNALGFGPDPAPGSEGEASDPARPSEGVVVGFQYLIVDAAAGTLAKTDPRVSIDLSAIAKGYAVDRIAEALAALGLQSFLVEIGGEVRTGGLKRDGTPWRVGVEQPTIGARDVFLHVELRDEAIATSGDYRNFYDRGSDRVAHIVDPRSGLPVAWTGFSVTVLHERAAIADAWATALSVMGPERGLDVAQREGLAVLFLRDGVNGIVPVASERFRSRSHDVSGRGAG